MGPKKKVQPGSQDNQQKVELLTKKIITIEQNIVIQQERADRSRTLQIENKNRILQIEKEFMAEKDRLYHITTEMKKQHQKTQAELVAQIDQLKIKEDGMKNEILKNQESITTWKKEHQEKIKTKDAELNQLKRKIEVITAQFARMLKDTLTKMQEKIEMQQWDSEKDPQLMKKMHDLSESLANK